MGVIKLYKFQGRGSAHITLAATYLIQRLRQKKRGWQLGNSRENDKAVQQFSAQLVLYT